MAQTALQQLKRLDPLQQRKAAAILGAIVSDAATAPLHWIYDQGKVKDLTTKGGTFEFYPESQCPFYTIETGRTSTYGDQLYVTLKSLAENKGLDPTKLADQIYTHFGPNTEYASARQQTHARPVKGPWTNHCVKIFMAKRENGEQPEADSGSKDPDGLVKAIPVVAFYSGQPNVLDQTENCIKVVQSNDVAVGYGLGGARVLDHVIQTGSDGLDAAVQQLKDPNRKHPLDIDATVAAAIETAKGASGKTHPEAVKEFGLSCGLPGSFHGMIHGIAVATDFQSAVRNGILAAGDNCSRGSFIGACAAAKFGLDSIPEAWVLKVRNIEEILGYIQTLVQ